MSSVCVRLIGQEVPCSRATRLLSEAKELAAHRKDERAQVFRGCSEGRVKLHIIFLTLLHLLENTEKGKRQRHKPNAQFALSVNIHA